MYTLTFSHVNAEGQRVLSLDERGQEVILQVDAPNKSATYYHPDVIAFCQEQGNDTRVRRVL